MQELRCRCGKLRGELDPKAAMGRAVCYCKDCQAYARFLGREGEQIDAHGGTDILACLPHGLRFTAGLEQLLCMSMSAGGLMRWHAGCCRTAIGNTPRDRGTAYVGLVHDCLPAEREDFAKTFGPLKIALNTGSARQQVGSTPLAMVFGVTRIVAGVIGARLGGSYRSNPFFDAKTGNPVRRPRELSAAERVPLYR